MPQTWGLSSTFDTEKVILLNLNPQTIYDIFNPRTWARKKFAQIWFPSWYGMTINKGHCHKKWLSEPRSNSDQDCLCFNDASLLGSRTINYKTISTQGVSPRNFI